MNSQQTFNEQVAAQIVKLRQKNDLSQADLAKRMNTDPSVISKLENGYVEITLNKLKSIADALETSIDVLLSLPMQNIAKTTTAIVNQMNNGTLSITITPQDMQKIFATTSQTSEKDL